ncbi:MAG: FecR domain-containing protein [Bacteroidales bacterium]|jgi:ferric-dicitrate binding protein FerR (iron transport regulator)|nr:FecR domain-containing protein [Bacteroidales bacterium]
MGNKVHIDWALFRKALVGNLDSAEEKAFNDWLNAKENRLYFDKALAFQAKAREKSPEEQYDFKKAWSEFERHHVNRDSNRFLTLARVAAILIILVALPIFLIHRVQNVETTGSDILPGRSSALLTLADGSTVVLETRDTVIRLKKRMGEIWVDSANIVYLAEDEGTGVSDYNILRIDHGREFSLTLSDGSRVWLNSETELRYPVTFTGLTREVYLSGEAYFEIAPDVNKPFIVNTGDLKLTVLGTSFNVSAYADDNLQVLTLAEGEIEITEIKGIQGESISLIPNQQIILDKRSLTTEVRQVDANLYSAWTRGRFVFEDETMFGLFQKLGRWYDISVFFIDSNAQYERLTGQLPRFESFDVIIDLLERVSDHEFEVENNIIKIK